VCALATFLMRLANWVCFVFGSVRLINYQQVFSKICYLCSWMGPEPDQFRKPPCFLFQLALGAFQTPRTPSGAFYFLFPTAGAWTHWAPTPLTDSHFFTNAKYHPGGLPLFSSPDVVARKQTFWPLSLSRIA